MAEPLELVLKDQGETVAWACGACRYVARDEAASRVLSEAADVATFAMMIADNVSSLAAPTKETP